MGSLEREGDRDKGLGFWIDRQPEREMGGFMVRG